MSVVQLALNLLNLGQKVHDVELSQQQLSSAISGFDNINLKLVQEINKQFAKVEGRIGDLEKKVDAMHDRDFPMITNTEGDA